MMQEPLLNPTAEMAISLDQLLNGIGDAGNHPSSEHHMHHHRHPDPCPNLSQPHSRSNKSGTSSKTAPTASSPQQQALKCPRCHSTNTKFCYFNNYSQNQPRHFCKNCRRYWTQGGSLRNVPPGGGCRKNKRVRERMGVGSLEVETIEDSGSDMFALNTAVGSLPVFSSQNFGDPNISPMPMLPLMRASRAAVLSNYAPRSHFDQMPPLPLNEASRLLMDISPLPFAFNCAQNQLTEKSHQESLPTFQLHGGTTDLAVTPTFHREGATDLYSLSATAALASALEEQLASFSGDSDAMNFEARVMQNSYPGISMLLQERVHDARDYEQHATQEDSDNSNTIARDDARPLTGLFDRPNEWHHAAGLADGNVLLEPHQNSNTWQPSNWQSMFCRQDSTPLVNPCTSSAL